MKPTKQKFFTELSKKRTSKINFSLNEDANKIIDELHNFSLTIGELSTKNNEAMDEYTRVKQKFADLVSEGENALTEYYSLKDAAGRVLLNAEEKISELGISPSDIPYYEELKNNINDTKEDEDALVFWVNNWETFARD